MTKLNLTALFLLLVASHLHAQSSSWTRLVTSEVGLDSARAFGQFVADINNDHYPDLVTVEGAWHTGAVNNLRVYLNIQDTASTDHKDRLFVDITAQSGVNAKPDGGDSRGTLAVALADVNNDGNIDLVKGSYYHRLATYIDSGDRCEVFLGDGMGNFNLVADNGLHELGLVNTMGFSFLDYNKDGNIDLFIPQFFKDYDANEWTTGILMQGKGDGTFTNVSAAAGINQKEPMYGSGIVDWNNDGWPDIATAPYCRTGGQLWKNNGDGTFTNVAKATGYNAQYMKGDNGQPLCMWSSVPSDFDNDGDMDFFFSLVHGGLDANEGHSTIVLNQGKEQGYKLSWDRSRTPRKSPRSTHLGDYDASWFDLDNDGLEDLVMVQGHYMPGTDRIYIFHQKADHSFEDITGQLGLINETTKDLHLVEVFDYDLDGDDDIVFCRNGQPRTLNVIRNEIGGDNNWLGIHLNVPEGVNQNGIGTRIYLWSGGVQKMREVYAGRGNGSGQQPFSLLFGIGKSETIDSVKVLWPDAAGSYSVVYGPEINRYMEIGPETHGTDGGYPTGIIAKQVAAKTTTLKVYPNPARDFVLVQLDNNEAITGLEIMDVLGRKMDVPVRLGSGATVYCPVGQFPAGQYYIKVMTKDGVGYGEAVLKR